MVSDESNIRVVAAVKSFIPKELLYDKQRSLDEETDLIEQGVIQLRLVSFLLEPQV